MNFVVNSVARAFFEADKPQSDPAPSQMLNGYGAQFAMR